jgi:hypothetical protein
MRKLQSLKYFFKAASPEVRKYIIIGLLYSLAIKTMFSIYMMDANLDYIICNPSLHSELLFFIVPSFYFIVHIFHRKWNVAFFNFLTSINILNRLFLLVKGLKPKYKLRLISIFQFLLFTTTALFFIALYGCYEKYVAVINTRDYNITQYNQLVDSGLYNIMAEYELRKLRIVPSLIFCAITCLCWGFMVREKWKSILRQNK